MALNAIPPVLRFINCTNPTELLIYTDGSCLDNGGQNAKAGCAFVFKDTEQGPNDSPSNGYVRFRLEEEGPTGGKYRQTSNRAELRAVIAALQFREWKREGFSSVVIATDSSYVAEGMTSWIRTWLVGGWKTSNGRPIINQDLWMCLISEVKRCGDTGLHIKFWQIPRDWNREADYHAKRAAETHGARVQFTRIIGSHC
jgi:ribonuclease HI